MARNAILFSVIHLKHYIVLSVLSQNQNKGGAAGARGSFGFRNSFQRNSAGCEVDVAQGRGIARRRNLVFHMLADKNMYN